MTYGTQIACGTAAGFVIGLYRGLCRRWLRNTPLAGSDDGENPTLTVEQTVTRCRISGGDVVDYANDDSVPSRLYPNVGFDLLGECWYVTSAETNYQIVPLNPDGGAELVLIVDGSPGPLRVLSPMHLRAGGRPSTHRRRLGIT